MFFNQIAFLTGKELISWPGLMSPRKTFTPETHYSTVKHNEITLSATFNKKNLHLQNSITAIKITESFSRTVHPKSQNRATHKLQTQTNKRITNSYHQRPIQRLTLFQLTIVSRETLNRKTESKKKILQKFCFT